MTKVAVVVEMVEDENCVPVRVITMNVVSVTQRHLYDRKYMYANGVCFWIQAT